MKRSFFAVLRTAVGFWLLAIGPTSGASFKLTGPLVSRRHLHTATLLPDGRVLVAGGELGYPTTTTAAELFDPGTGNWTATGTMNSPRSGHQAVQLANGKVLVIGGSDAGGFVLGTAEIYDPGSKVWTPTGSLVHLRRRFTATLLPNGRVLVAGGSSTTGAVEPAELYDPATGLWTDTGALTAFRNDHTATLLPSGKVLVAGGERADAEVYNPATGQWTADSLLNETRANHIATLMPNGKVLVTGKGTAEVYNPVNSTWTYVASVSVGVDKFEYCPGAVLPDGKVLVAGGNYYNFSAGVVGFFDISQLFEPGSGTWTAGSKLNEARYQHTATVLKDGRVVVVGGVGKPGILSSAELYGDDVPVGVKLTDISRTDTGAFAFRFNSTPGQTYTVVTSTNLASPLAAWNTTPGLVETTAGSYRFVDPQSPPSPLRFFRVRSP